MEFNFFINQISKIENLPLPGEQVHLEMAPIERLLELKSRAISKNTAKKAGVVALFYPDNVQQVKLALILRKSSKGVHSAQVGFPGGKVEEIDNTILDTALRETEEEIGVIRSTIQIVKQLTEIYIPPSNFLVQPFMGMVSKTPQFKIQPSEVESLIEVSLDHFMDDTACISKNLTTSYAKDIQVPAFYLNNHVVWGATAMMLNEIRHLLKKVV